MTDWIRRTYDSVGVTQWPAGPHLAALQEPYLGKVFLCIDVSSSMSGQPLREAVAGAHEFVAQAIAARYRVGLILWNTGVAATVGLSARPEPVLDGVRRASAGGGTNVTPTLQAGISMLAGLRGDRVLAVFGDGDIGAEGPAVAAAREAAAQGIRIIVRGLGRHAAASLAKIATEGIDQAEIAGPGQIAGGIAAMATSLISGRRKS
ncbi:VWA domain-containing protein [Actinoplanes bogorensis]|uniref:VWA domain-containing protein n=1 Tax=Paractinoplanes bogorensis TaxID=1610840 RepID=A0ABS5YXW6_9ACTN|nr:vWA domain-containing protein [Actinoplanes bogorensis]MBU2668228.1 VWA domain-containing protein [Actinoplanes bogorensis]